MGSAAVTPAFALQKANSMSFLATTTDLDSTFSNAALILGQPAGPLLTFLSTSFADETAANAAFAAIGGRIDIRQTSVGTASTSALQAFWVCSTAVPALTLRQVGTSNAVYEMTISAIHSLVQ